MMIHPHSFWHWLGRQPQNIVVIYIGNLLTWVAMFASDACVAWFSQMEFAVGRTSSYHSRAVLPPESTGLHVTIFGSFTALMVLTQYVLGRLGWKLVRPRARFRARLFMNAWIYAALATGPALFVADVSICCLRIHVLRRGLPTDVPIGLLVWLTYSLFATTAIAMFWIRRRARRLVPRCRSCGYLLRGLTSSRCPECGEPTAARS
jgi:hypothetical protein